MPLIIVSLLCCVFRFWPNIDDALRRAVYERGVNVRLMGSHWNQTAPDMIRFMKSIAEVNNTGDHHGIMEAVSQNSLHLTLLAPPPITTSCPEDVRGACTNR